MRKEFEGFIKGVKSLVDSSTSQRAIEQYKYPTAIFLRLGLGTILHPLAAFNAAMAISDESRVRKNLDRMLSIPGLPRERDEFRQSGIIGGEN